MAKPKPRLMGTRTAPMYLDYTREVSVVSPASTLLVREKRKTSMFSDMAALPCRWEGTQCVLLPTLGLGSPGADPAARLLPCLPSVPKLLGLPVSAK